jgi:Protein of unknown function (DUF2608)
MKNFIITLCIILNVALAEIIETNDIEKISAQILDSRKDLNAHDMLVIFSIENTILIPSDNKLLFKNEALIEPNPIIKKIFSNLNIKKADYIPDVIFTSYEHKLVDKNIPRVIQDLQKSSIPIIVLSKGLIGKLNEVQRLEANKAVVLKKFGIDLSDGFSKNDFIIKDQAQKSESKAAKEVFYNGIITYNPELNINAALLNFLIQIKFNPLIIIAIDYDKSNLRSIETQLQSFSNQVKFIGYHYTAIDQMDSEVFNSNQTTIDYLQTFVNKVNNAKR